MVDGDQHSSLDSLAAVGRGNGLVAIRQVGRYRDVELILAGKNQSGELDGRGCASDLDYGEWERLPDWDSEPLTTGVEVGPKPLP